MTIELTGPGSADLLLDVLAPDLPALTRFLTTRLERLPGLVSVDCLFATSLTFAGFDWLMSLDPLWYSTIFGVYLFAGTVVSSLALLSVLGVLLGRAGYLNNVITAEHYRQGSGFSNRFYNRGSRAVVVFVFARFAPDVTAVDDGHRSTIE